LLQFVLEMAGAGGIGHRHQPNRPVT